MKVHKKIKQLILAALCVCLLAGNTMTAEAAPKKTRLTALTFDVDYYYNTYADLQEAIGYDYEALYRHYLKYGVKEGRFGSAEFSCAVYKDNYGDLRKAFQNDYEAYCLHYEQFGKAEGRNALERMPGAADSTQENIVSGEVLGTYSTIYDATIQRAINVELSASRINGVVIAPGGSFSYNLTVLPRTAANGYVKAPVISGGRYTLGYGGGICQTSSTLYAAMLDAGLPATERHPHSLKVTYMPEGMDATISGNVKDLKFVNIFDRNIQIVATTDSETGTLTVSLVAQ